MYKVIRHFNDLQDNKYPYSEGDIFPRDGLSVTKERLAELSGSNNKQKRPLIEKVKDKKLKYTKTEINRMSTAELQNLSAEIGIENAFETSGGELKKILTNHFGL